MRNPIPDQTSSQLASFPILYPDLKVPDFDLVKIVTKAKLRLQRKLAAGFYKKPAAQVRPVPIVSFTFDDFPLSALTEAGSMLSERHLQGTYYASAGLLGRQSIMGDMFNRSDLSALVHAGHELACHTFDHVRSCDVPGRELLSQCEINRRHFAEMLDGYKVSNFSYPEGVVNPAAKRLLNSVYETCRTVEPGINRDPIDLGFLRANCIYTCLLYTSPSPRD